MANRRTKDNSMKLILATLAALSVSSAALAQGHDMPGMTAADHAPMPAPAAPGAGVIKKLDTKTGAITLQHGPIAALKWPAMTMPFKAAPSLLQGLKVGQKVNFTVKPGATPEIISIKIAG